MKEHAGAAVDTQCLHVGVKQIAVTEGLLDLAGYNPKSCRSNQKRPLAKHPMTQELSRKDFMLIAASGAAGASIRSDARGAQPMPSLAPELFCAARIPNGYTWTLASRFGDMLSLAEDLLGPRDLTYTILGVEIGPDVPRLWYPGNRHNVIVQLAPSAATNMARACYQLAHETVHLLAPNGGGPATNLEEAVACYFAAYFMKSRFAQPARHPQEPSYRRGLGLISARMDADARCIRRLRSRQLSFSGITKDELSAAFPDLGPGEVDFLRAKFDRGETSRAPLRPRGQAPSSNSAPRIRARTPEPA